jgi:hypothetical protein
MTHYALDVLQTVAHRRGMLELSSIVTRISEIAATIRAGAATIRAGSELKTALPKGLFRAQHHNGHAPSIEGKWRVVHVGEPWDGDLLEASWTIEVELFQDSNKVHGEATARCIAGSSEGTTVQYLARGAFLANIVDLALQDVRSSSRNRSVFLLQVIGDGSCMEGFRTFLGRNKNTLRVIQCKWQRIDGPASVCGTG